ncbi:MAG: choice-of-anchor J domain-containing protein [Planctomycetes bacterium]|nr:choice-of-anchor J domain-containing protein [Planctomycetota bacterium]
MQYDTESNTILLDNRLHHIAPLLIAGLAWFSLSGATASAQPIRFYDTSNPLNSSRNLVPTAKSRPVNPVELVDVRLMPGIDLLMVEEEDLARDAQGLPYRFAIANDVFLTPENSGTWEQLDRDTWLWRLRLVSAGAVSINLGFTRYDMPEGGTLFVYTTDGSSELRGFTAADNEAHGQLWTPPLNSDDIIVEVTLPSDVLVHLELELTRVNHGYRGFDKAKGDKSALSGSCNVDVNCPEGATWTDEIASVALIIVNGETLSTGFMVNNTANDRKPYFMTAYHSGLNAANDAALVVFWNYENSTCRTPGSVASGAAGDGVMRDFNTGSSFRSRTASSDFCLVELDDYPDASFGVSYAGWDRSGAAADSAICIHHPQGEEKRISFEDNPTSITTYLQNPVPGDGTHIRVTDWDLGTTEDGSSGSPLFDANHRIIGQLHGGYAACSNNDSDWYGRFFTSWTGSGTPSTRLSDWLDPLSSGALTTNTLGPISPFQDCNLNGLPDAMDISSLTSLDCNSDSIPDECQLGTDLMIENFDDISLLPGLGWDVVSNSSPLGPFTWFGGIPLWFSAFRGSAETYVASSYQAIADSSSGTISEWLMIPPLTLKDGLEFSFYTRTLWGNTFPDRIQVRMSLNGSSINVGSTPTSVGDFTTLLLDINPTLTTNGYPFTWQKYTVVLSGIGTPTTGRMAFRYFVINGGPNGANSNFIGVDNVRIVEFTNDTNDNGIPDTCEFPPCPADFNSDTNVNVTDLLALLAAWGTCLPPCPPDINSDGFVNVTDLLALLGAWGSCP